MYNICSYLYEFHTGETYSSALHSSKVSDLDWCSKSSDSHTSASKDLPTWLQIVFLPCDPRATFQVKRNKYVNKFDVVYVSAAMSHRIPDASEFMAPTGESVMLVESPRYVPS
jgi:hypothetical protein